MYILETNLLLITSVANTLPYSKGCLFILFFGFLCYAKAFKFIRSNVLNGRGIRPLDALKDSQDLSRVLARIPGFPRLVPVTSGRF